MRLIDVDNFKKNNHEYLQLDIDYVTEVTVEDVLDCEPTAKAIPIEWIKNYIIPFQVFHNSLSEETKENDGAGWVVDVLETMLREWEKENETN